MIGKKEWADMARQVYEMEKMMQSFYRKMAEQISDAELKNLLAALVRDEETHAAAISSIAEKIRNS